jgi:hypothetical protein
MSSTIGGRSCSQSSSRCPSRWPNTPENIAHLVDGMFSINSTGHPVAHMSVPEHFVFTSRVQLAISSVCAGLNATLPARAIADDMDGVAEPVTELGKLHHAWVRDRGLPSALDHHDHP